MKFLPQGWRTIRRIWQRTPEREVDAEVAFHLEERTAELIAGGALPGAARAQAEAEFGDVAAVRGGLVAIDTRLAERRSLHERWEWLGQDLRYVWRSLRRSPGFVVTVSLTLALGLGANAAIFSLLDRLFLRPQSGIADPSTIHRIYEYQTPRPGGPPPSARHPRDGQAVFAFGQYREMRQAISSAIPFAGYVTGTAAYGEGSDPPKLVESFVVGDYFSLLGARAVRGRFFSPDEMRIAVPLALVVISERLWKGQFGASPDVIGRMVEIDGHQHEVIGVVAGSFHGPDNDAVDLWVPLNTLYGFKPSTPPWYEGTHSFNIRTLVRVAASPSLQAVRLAATQVFRHGTVVPDSQAEARIGGIVEPVMPGFDRSSVEITTRLAGVSLIILLIACANVGNLLLARGLRRRKEIAVRLALGVTRRRLVGTLLIEGLLVSLCGAVLALGVAVWAAAALRRLLLPDVQWADAAIDQRIILFILILTVITAFATTLLPALQATNPDLVDALKAGGREGGVRRSRLRTGMLMAQAALSVVLLAGAGVFLRSLHSVETTDIGIDGNRLVFADVSWNRELADRSRDVAARIPELVARIRRTPGVEQVGLISVPPMRGMQFMDIHLPGRDSVPHTSTTEATTTAASPDYFRATGIRLISGRGILASDDAGAAPIILVNQTIAKMFWPGENPLDKCVIVGAPDAICRQVVGVVTDTHQGAIVEDGIAMQMYIPMAQYLRPNDGTLIVRSAPGSAKTLVPVLRALISATVGPWAVPRVHALSEYLDQELRPWRMGAALFAAAGFLALVVSLVGIYSTISYIFSQRTHEIGVRIALGARAPSVVRLVVGEGVRLVLAGVAVGVVLSLLAGNLIAALLYHTSARDPLVLGVVAATLLFVAAIACLIPAWRALRVDPVVALRAD